MMADTAGTANTTDATVTIRPVRLADAVILNQHCWPERSCEDVLEFLQRTHKLTQNRRGVGVVALCMGALCGFGMLTLWPRAAEISDLIVSPDFRSQGIGSRIIAYLAQYAAHLNVQTLEIGVALSNPRALALYRRLGFVDGRVIELDLGHGPEPVLYLYQNLG
ncbi:MAG: GNAT family N-acetyltransferase [Chloroflexi bacterium]|nr:GNAT family N-acetyltransferase [Chloroflexota bacterium]